MFFTKLGKVIAGLALVLGVIRVGLGLIVAFATPDMESNIAASQRYLAASNSGEAIGEGTIYIIVAVTLGILCEISARRTHLREPT